ncbi:MAG: coenzyme F420-0:L-glutamate ligase / coenzyme F420:gamma-L-glutamate ligase [Actinoplanes sp.]|jgi:coenzyme F420-0:L-glutamate ligase/coenzyme F420-1:gamma-L-glutamate ligase|nr:coenzyme F420-0:L-glutamate ligase / coenzyme F420:gamma-L-glutamate ligase [Actinoplanes sp.]
MNDGLEIRPVRGIGDVTAGDDLAELITAAAPWLADGDVLVVTSKIVSKAEGNLVEVPADGPEREAARERVLAAETARVVARRGTTAIVQTHHGFVMAAAGVDASNVDKTHLVLLPADPDASARALRAALLARGLDVAVVISDTMGRAWRNGLTDVALGAAGIEAFRDHRGEIDPYGNELQLTQMAVIDELAAAGELVKGKCDQVPVAVVRGYPGTGPGTGESGAKPLLRDAASDMFALGTAEARIAGLTEAARLPSTPAPTAGKGVVDRAVIDRALATVAGAVSPGTAITVADAVTLALTPPATTPADLMRLGADAHRLRAALAAEGVTTELLPQETVLLLKVTTG